MFFLLFSRLLVKIRVNQSKSGIPPIRIISPSHNLPPQSTGQRSQLLISSSPRSFVHSNTHILQPSHIKYRIYYTISAFVNISVLCNFAIRLCVSLTVSKSHFHLFFSPAFHSTSNFQMRIKDTHAILLDTDSSIDWRQSGLIITLPLLRLFNLNSVMCC